MARKLAFYDRFGAEEYYDYDPDHDRLRAFRRDDGQLDEIEVTNGLTSPRLGIRFDLSGLELVIRRPDGQPFLGFEELDAARGEAEVRAAAAEDRAAKLAAKLRALGIDPDGD
jgi:hypothetical protein